MQFTNAEVRFISSRHGNMTDITAGMRASCPKPIMQLILEKRAKTLGVEFKAFQEEQRMLANPNSPYVAPEHSKSNASELF